MPKTGTLTKARIAEAVVETNGYTQQRSYKTKDNSLLEVTNGMSDVSL